METLQHKFVEFMPEQPEDGILYISMEYCLAVHKCVCGCGNEVVTPFSPTDWKMIFNGVAVSLSPSIGNWGFECRSHYWITNNTIAHAGKWTEKQVEDGRKKDRKNKDRFFRKRKK